jgi:hypothetical protein
MSPCGVRGCLLGAGAPGGRIRMQPSPRRRQWDAGHVGTLPPVRRRDHAGAMAASGNPDLHARHPAVSGVEDEGPIRCYSLYAAGRVRHTGGVATRESLDDDSTGLSGGSRGMSGGGTPLPSEPEPFAGGEDARLDGGALAVGAPRLAPVTPTASAVLRSPTPDQPADRDVLTERDAVLRGGSLSW